MKTLSMWAFESGAREIDIHDVDPELFEKLRPAFDDKEGRLDHVGQINVDKNTTIIFFKKQEEKEESNESAVEDSEAE